MEVNTKLCSFGLQLSNGDMTELLNMWDLRIDLRELSESQQRELFTAIKDIVMANGGREDIEELAAAAFCLNGWNLDLNEL